ncbi:hypothetical protein SIL81_19965 [Xanthomonas campestris pv. incanae]|uniref:hypothetical protein n=1 Tax=Xanthomonas campestris TaxID=339 RepID=UPI0029C4771C|nr:hypothetical protein [Xanthomonas campestris]MDX6083761.1 hypothetical protein [Xanthomonas campestris pv. incanae]MDX6087888.1 hypothetical protein [Xanthomonas campestris pv. incanae]MDX6141416.1 hypothetical protein [Xanthomonas campestris pv. incanae]
MDDRSRVEYYRRLLAQRRSSDHEEQHTSWLDRWGGRAANWSQLLTLLLLGFGYFYTVRPVYQKDLLEEQSAKLQMEKERLEKQNSLALAKAKSMQAVLSELQTRREALQQQNSDLQMQQSNLSREVGKLRQSSRVLDQQLATLNGQNADQREQLVEGHKALLKGSLLYWARGVLDNRDILPFSGGDEALNRWVNKVPLQPVQVVLDVIDKEISDQSYFGLPAPQDVSKQVVEEFRQGVLTHKDGLTCPNMDRRAWKESWLRNRQRYLSQLSECVDAGMTSAYQDQGFNLTQIPVLRKTASWKRQAEILAISCRIVAERESAELFDRAWRNIEQACHARLFNAAEVALGGTPELPSFPSTEPPAPKEKWFQSN